MKGKVKCTCGWSWNKSDSSVKDMYICHQCGRDNSNNMKNGGGIPKAQDGIIKDERSLASKTSDETKIKMPNNTSIDKRIQEEKREREDEKEFRSTGFVKYPRSIKFQKQEKELQKKQTYVNQDNRTEAVKQYDEAKGKSKEFKKTTKPIIKVADVATDIMQLGNFVPHPIGQAIGEIGNIAGTAIDTYQAADDFSEGDYVSGGINTASVFLPMALGSQTFRRNSKYLQPGQPLYPLSPQANLPFGTMNIPRVSYIEPFTKVKGMTDASLFANRALLGTLGAETIYDTFGGSSESIDTPTFQYQNIDLKEREEEPVSNPEQLKKLKKQKSKFLPKSIEIPEGEDIDAFEGKKGVLAKNGGWLNKYADGGTMQEHQENYNDSYVALPKGFVGMGNNTKGRNYSPAWGGQFQIGGNVYPVNYVPQAQEGETMFKKPSILQQEYIDPIYSYSERTKLYPGEEKAFKERPDVAGMAAEDNRVIINPYSPISKEMKDLVRTNETARLAMRGGYPRPDFELTPKQQEFFNTVQNGKPYSEDLQDIKETIAARVMTGDDSAQDYTKEQEMYADKLFDVLKKSKEYATGMSGMMKSKIGMGNAFEHPAIKRMSQAMPKTGMTPEGTGTHYMSSVDNYAVPELQDLGEEELTLVNPDSRSREAIRFNSPEEANYFAKNYKDVAPMTNIFGDLNSFKAGGSIPGTPGFTYARTKGIPSNGPYAKKTMASAQNGVDMHGSPITAIEKHRYDIDRSYYDPRTNIMNLGYDYAASDDKDKMIAHENYHAKQHKEGRDNFDIAHNTDNEQWARMQKRPQMMTTPEVWNNFYNRKAIESDMMINKIAERLPESQFFRDAAGDIIYNKIVDPRQYKIPYSFEGEAEYYENTGEEFQNGGEMRYYQNGLDWKPKGMKNGGWLSKYEEGGVIKDDRGQWAYPGEITEIGSNQITMQGVPYPVLGISDTGDVQMMYPEEEYEFDGEKVTEIPMAQDGKKFDFSNGPAGNMKQSLITAMNKDKKQTPNTKEQKTTAVDKTSVKQNKQKKIVDVPLTEKEILYNSINNQARFMKDWMNSPMYDEMVDNSTTGYFDKQYLNSGRDFNFNNIKVQLHPQPKYNPNTGASSNNETGLIKLFPLGAKDDAVQGMLAHEFSHSSDRPTYWKSDWFQQHGLKPANKYNQKYHKKEIRLIPEKDINLMKSFYSDNKVYKNLFNQSALKDDELNEQREWFNYVSDPTETRARLNDIRYNAKINGVYDPFTQKVTPEILNEIKELTKKAGGFDPFYQLQGVYSDEEILKLLNTVSQNEQPNENPNVALAKDGIRQEQKGLVNLNNLTNFTNYNKPQPGGWLDKYEDGGPVLPTPNTQVQVKKEIPFEKIPTTDNKKIVIDNFSPDYDYVVEGDNTYYKVKGGNTWADISNNTKARKNLLEFLDKNNYWAGYGSGEKAKFDKIKNQPVVVPGGKVPKTTPTIVRNTETGNKPVIVKRPIQKVIKEEPGFFDDISDFVSSEVDSLEKKWGDVKQEAKTVAKKVGDAVTSGIDNAITTTEDAYHTVINGIQRKYKTHTGDDDDAEVKTSANENPKTVKEWYGNKSGAEITQVLDAPNVPGRTYKQQVLPTSNIKFGVRNRGEYKDIKTDGLEVTTFQPFTKNALPDDASVLAIDANGNLHTGQYKEFKGKKDYMFSRTFRNKIIDFPEVNGKGEYVSGAKSGNPKYQQPKVKVLDDNGKVVNGSLNILVKDDSKKDYYGQVQGGRILFVNPTTKEQYLVSGSMNHIKQKFKELKGNNKYLEAYTLDNGTYSRGLSYKDKKLTKDRLKSYDLENTSGGNGLYIVDYKQPVSKYNEEYIDNMPNVRTKNDESYKKGHPLKNEIKNIVLHHTAYVGTNAEKELNKQYMTPGKSSSHIVIQENGKRSIYASPEQVTFHAGESEWNKRKDVNDFSIGVEFQGDTNKKPLTQAQIESFVEYYAPLAKKYNLSLKDIITHQMIAPGRKPDINEKQYARILKYMRDKNFK